MRSSQGCMWVPVHDQRIQQAFEVLPVRDIRLLQERGGREGALGITVESHFQGKLMKVSTVQALHIQSLDCVILCCVGSIEACTNSGADRPAL